MARRPLPWPSGRALRAVLALAARVAPLATLAALATLLSGKRVRAWNALCRLAARHPADYRRWVAHTAPLREAHWIGGAAALPGLTIAALPSDDVRLHDLLASTEADGRQWLVPLWPGDRTSAALPSALGAALSRWPDARIIFWDEDVKTPAGRAEPWLKPAWDPLLHMARDCLGGASAIHVETACAALATLPELPATAAGLARLQLAMLGQGAVPAHVPLILTHRASAMAPLPHWPALVEAHWPGWQIVPRGDNLPFLRVLPPVPAVWPAVSIIIPTRDRADLMRTCLSGLARLSYPGRVEIIVVDNGSRDAEALALLDAEAAAGRIRLLRDEGPFNFSRLNNRAAASASGDYLCLFNNDVEALDGDWLALMVRHALCPGVGAVGAQLLYPDGSIQHAGVTVGLGDAAGHVQRGIDPASRDHAAWHAVTRQVSVVTAACLLVARQHYAAVGGLDEAGFAVAFNDVDFCLKLQASGLANVYCAESRLIHAESRTRPRDHRPDQVERFNRERALLQQRWRTAGRCDPHHNPLFSATAEACLLSMA
ncbi:glycosyltransferase family 2 protein [Sandarakinorhabdus sp. AAP62]|uniref:glycosyltransferase family 2 protein n=1 Tax=Sandarakinorhabdus sp. AAP62 TaxID=1248916 RepID=UPI00031BDB7F|nr:glycosyltransferase family 2 protein [Sandarakinorhabdus sp. AAP62]